MGVRWKIAEPFEQTTFGDLNYSGGDWKRWITNISEDDAAEVEALSRFAVSCSMRLGRVDLERDEIQRLIETPQESLHVELKPWLDPQSKPHKAKIAKAAIALRNNGGGYLVLGFENDGKPSPNPPPDLQIRYHVDEVQQIVSKYSSKAFEVSVEFRTVRGVMYPIVVVPKGVETPVFAKSTLKDDHDCLLIEDDTIYVRSIASNNRVSSSKLRRQDIDRLMKICFDNREADVARFIRRHLPTLPDVLKEVSIAPIAEPIKTPIAILEAGFERYLASIAERGLVEPSLGFLEAGAVFDGDKEAVPDESKLLRLRSTRRNLSGWPPWLIMTNHQDPTSRPRVVGHTWEALLDRRTTFTLTPHFDFWKIDPHGSLYTLRAIQDDLTPGLAPGNTFDFVLAIYRVTEIVLAVLQIARELGGSEASAEVGLSIRFRGMKGRRLASWSEPRSSILGGYRVYEEILVAETLSMPLELSDGTIPSIVHKLLTPVFAAFQGAHIDRDTVEEMSQAALERR